MNWNKGQLVLENHDSYEVYKFVGEIDEAFKFQNVPPPQTKHVYFDLKEVENINSCGIREWIDLIFDFSKKCQITYKRCSVAMVDQINMVPELAHSAIIESIMAPYYCDEHGELSIEVGEDGLNQYKTSDQPPEYSCPHCSKPLEFDALADSYFLFLKNTNKNAS